MEYVEIAVCFIIGAILVILAGLIFNLKTKGVYKLILNTVAGSVLLIVLSLTGLVSLALSPFNALLTGALGIPGLILIISITFFL